MAYGEQPVRKVTWRERRTEKQIEERERESIKTVRLILEAKQNFLLLLLHTL